MNHSNDSVIGQFLLVITFIIGTAEELAKLDFAMGLIVKICSMISFVLFIIINHSRIKIEFLKIIKKIKA